MSVKSHTHNGQLVPEERGVRRPVPVPRTAVQQVAEDRRPQSRGGALAQIEATIFRLTYGGRSVPDGLDVGDFLVSGGTLAPPTALTRKSAAGGPSVRAAVGEYVPALEHLAPSNRMTTGVHLRNLLRGFGKKADGPVAAVKPALLDDYLDARLRERQGNTVAKERATLVAFFRWCVGREYLAASPAAALKRVKSTGRDRPFMSLAQIDAVIARGGLPEEEEWAYGTACS